MQDWN